MVTHTDSGAEGLIPYMVVFGGRAFGKKLGVNEIDYKGETTMKISVPLGRKKDKSSLSTHTVWGHSKRKPSCRPRRERPSQVTQFLSSNCGKINSCL